MEKFLLKILAFIVVTLIVNSLYIYFFADSGVDAFYDRVTTKKYGSLILGTSRVAQGIEPEKLNEILKLKNKEIYNFAFTVNRTLWGEPYLNSIKKKLDKSRGASNIFILECNPWAFCSDRDKIGNFIERKAAPNNLLSVSSNPNIQYFYGGYSGTSLTLLLRKFMKKGDNIYRLNGGGRLVVSVDYDSLTTEKKIVKKIKEYRETAKRQIWDTNREESFRKVITYLKKYGEVYLLRMPVADEMMSVETKYFPMFSKQMVATSNSYEISYLDYSCLSNSYLTVDGNHLHKRFVDDFSKRLAEDIAVIRENSSSPEICKRRLLDVF